VLCKYIINRSLTFALYRKGSVFVSIEEEYLKQREKDLLKLLINFKERLPENDIDAIVKIVFQKESIKRKQKIIRRKYILLAFNEEEEKCHI
jgi:hypothetical protein